MSAGDVIRKKITELEEARRVAEINMHRADAAIWALKSILNETAGQEETGQGQEETGQGSGDNK